MKTAKISYKRIMLLLLLAAALLLAAGCGRAEQAEPVLTPAPTPTPDPFEGYAGKLRISEVMVKNRATLPGEDGGFSDWLELENISAETLQLEGLLISDKEGEGGWSIPAVSLEPGAYLVLRADGTDIREGELHTDFSLSAGETLSLKSPAGIVVDTVLLAENEADCSELFAGVVGEISRWPTPGYENTAAGYEAFCSGRAAAQALVINEVSVYDLDGEYDWVELKNVSSQPVELSGFYLSDDHENRALWQLPQQTLAAGEYTIIRCDKEDAALDGSLACFSLDGGREGLYLSSADGTLVDFVSLHDIALGGSMGRNEGQQGFFYLEEKSPGSANVPGLRRVSAQPVALTADGVFNDVSSVILELDAPGSIYYTTDGTVPTESSALYSGALEISETSVVRAIAVEEGALPSRVLTLSYIMNEGHTLPVLSLVVDSMSDFNRMYNNSRKGVECTANIAFYEPDGSFNIPCLVSLKGWTSLSLPKKSFGVSFKSALGGDLEYDVFDNGISSYSSLSIRAGQDYTFAYIRNELFQEICLDMDTPVLTQESKYSVLYINGEYRGLYCLKEDISRSYYASHAGVSKDSVEAYKAHFEINDDFRENVYKYCLYNDLSDPECYETICSRIDVDAMLDWFILQGYSANTDVRGNTRFYRSPENGYKWQVAFYDLDWAFYYPNCAFNLMVYAWGNAGIELPEIMVSLLENEEFRTKFLTRYSELSRTLLSDESVLARIDRMAAEIEPEVARDRERWWLSTDAWYSRVEELRGYIINNDYNNFCIDQVCSILDLTDEERAYWFG